MPSRDGEGARQGAPDKQLLDTRDRTGPAGRLEAALIQALRLVREGDEVEALRVMAEAQRATR